MPFRITIFRIKKRVVLFRMTIFQIKKRVVPFHITKKLILEIALFVRQGRGVLNTPHMYLDFWSHVPFGDILKGRIAIRPYRDTKYVVSHDHFSIKIKMYSVSHDHFSIQIKGQYILHRSLFDQKEDHAVSHELCFDSGKSEYVLQDYILDRKY